MQLATPGHFASLDSSARLSELCVFRPCMLQDGKVRIGVFPDRKEILICCLGFHGIAGISVGAA